MQKIFGIIGYKTGGARAEAEKKQTAEEKAAAYADLLLIVLAAACLTAGGILRYQRANSAAYQLKRAQEAFDQKNYTSALDYVNRALQLEDGSEDALLLQGQIYQMMKEDDQAEHNIAESDRSESGLHRGI